MLPIVRKVLLICLLASVFVTFLRVVWWRPDLDTCTSFAHCLAAVNRIDSVANLSSKHLDQYLNIIRKNFLTPPAPPESQLKLYYPMWNSPVTSLVHKLLQYKKHGFFIEAGALNGEEISNSIQLEVNSGWEGLLVEPDPRNLVQLYTKNRKSWISPVCLSPTGKPQTMPMLVYNRFRHMTHITGLFHNQSSDSMAKDSSTLYNIQCLPLGSLLQALNRSDVDYLSLDIEGAELGVLQTLPWDKLLIKVISVEMNNKDQVFGFLKSKGYDLKQTFDLPDKGVRDAVFFFKG